MRILVTGDTGFIASELIPKLVKHHKVSTLNRYVTGRLHDYHEVSRYYCNLEDYFQVREVIRSTRPDVIFHLAALTAVSHSYDRPLEYMHVNLDGTIGLAEACLRENPDLKAFIFASTSETYGTQEGVLTEDSPQYPTSPYAVAKVAGEEYLKYMGRAYKFPYVIVRPFNTYGRKRDRHFFIEKLLSQMSVVPNKKVLLGDPDIVRDFMYVSDHVAGYLSILNALEDGRNVFGQVFQFCTGMAYPLRKVVDMAGGVTGWKGEVVWNTIPRRPDDAKVLLGSFQKAMDTLGWEPQIPLEEGLRLTLESWK